MDELTPPSTRQSSQPLIEKKPAQSTLDRVRIAPAFLQLANQSEQRANI
jgi:hypothetical protein